MAFQGPGLTLEPKLGEFAWDLDYAGKPDPVMVYMKLDPS
jgi:hypothetical protein